MLPAFPMRSPATGLALLLWLNALPAQAGGGDPAAAGFNTSTVTSAGSNATSTAAATAAGSTPITDRLIIKYRAGSAAAARPDLVTMAAAHEAVNRAGLQMTRLRSTAQAAQVMALDRGLGLEQARALAAEIARSDANVEYAEPDLLLQKQLLPNDPSYASQWHYSEATAGINAPAAWSVATGAGVVVAVVDTGYRPHADLAANLLAGYDMISSAAVANDGNARDSIALDAGDAVVAGECGTGTSASASSWHGTHVAGTIGAVTNNGLGVAGVAFGARLLPVRVLGKCGGYTSDIADAITWAAGGSVSGVPANTTPARVINLSLGGSGSCATTMQTAITSARLAGALVVVAAGNSAGSAANAMPANCHGVLPVTAVNRSGGRAYYANYGSPVALAAPGGDMRNSSTDGILSTLNSGSSTPGADSYAWYQGTSMATPHVAGVAALALSARPTLTVEQLDALLRSSVRAFPVACSGCGSGITDAALAVQAAAAAPVLSVTAVAELESNNTQATAQSLATLPALVSGTIASTTDVDWYRISLNPGRTLAALLTPNAQANYNLALYNASGTQLASSSSSGLGATDALLWTNTGSSAISVALRVSWGAGGAGRSPTATYTLKVTQ